MRVPLIFILKIQISMAKKEIERLEKRIELLEMQVKELESVQPDIIEQRFKNKTVFRYDICA